jgi:hypothetical protein
MGVPGGAGSEEAALLSILEPDDIPRALIAYN